MVAQNHMGVNFIWIYPGLEDKIIFMYGWLMVGMLILIDVENSRILVINSLHYNNKKYKYNHKKLIYNILLKKVNEKNLYTAIFLLIFSTSTFC